MLCSDASIPETEPVNVSCSAVDVGDGVAVGVGVALGDTVGETLGFAVGEADGDTVGLPVGEAEGEALGEEEGSCEGDSSGFKEPLGVGVADGSGEGSGLLLLPHPDSTIIVINKKAINAVVFLFIIKYFLSNNFTYHTIKR